MSGASREATLIELIADLPPGHMAKRDLAELIDNRDEWINYARFYEQDYLESPSKPSRPLPVKPPSRVTSWESRSYRITFSGEYGKTRVVPI